MPEATQLIKVTTIKNITLMKKILVIINKNWETEPVLNALTNPKLRPAALPFPEVINTPCDDYMLDGYDNAEPANPVLSSPFPEKEKNRCKS